MTTATGITSVSDFADELLGEEPGVDLARAGDACAELGTLLESEGTASSVIATVVWDVFCRSAAFDECLESLAGKPPRQATEAFVVRHPLFGGQPRHDLIVFDDAMEGYEPRIAELPPDTPSWTESGLKGYLSGELRSSLEFPVERWAEAISEAIAAQAFGLIVAEPSRMLPLSGPPFRVPVTPRHVRRRQDESRYATAGMVACSSEGAVVVTTALHSLRDSDDESIPIGTEVWIDEAPGAVSATDPVSDSAIVTPDHAEELDATNWRSLGGPLHGMTPRENEQATFEGAGSGAQHPYVTGWSPDLLTVQPYNQVKVMTTPDTVPGDSGAALFDEQGRLLGFAFARSEFDARPEYSSWIWGDSVVAVHRLRACVAAAPE